MHDDDFRKEKVKHEFFMLINRMKRLPQGVMLKELTTAEYVLIETIIYKECSGCCLETFYRVHTDKEKLEEWLESSIKEKVCVNDIAELIGVTPAAVSKQLSNLEKKGYVSREVSEKNRRNTYVHLTKDGCDVWIREDKNLKRFCEKITSKYGVEKAEQLLGLMTDLYKVFEEEMNMMKDGGEQC